MVSAGHQELTTATGGLVTDAAWRQVQLRYPEHDEISDPAAYMGIVRYGRRMGGVLDRAGKSWRTIERLVASCGLPLDVRLIPAFG